MMIAWLGGALWSVCLLDMRLRVNDCRGMSLLLRVDSSCVCGSACELQVVPSRGAAGEAAHGSCCCCCCWAEDAKGEGEGGVAVRGVKGTSV
eukprot:1150275-Pelagomonas_calceolata.AAC.6